MSLWVVFPPHNASQSPVQHYHFLYLTSLFPTISRSTVVVGQLVGFWIIAPAPLHKKDSDTFLALL